MLKNVNDSDFLIGGLAMKINLNKVKEAKKIWRNEAVFIFTVDVDWASEDALKYCYSLFEQYGIPVTFFITHPSNFLNEKIEKGIIDAGIHPNFLKGSSQGNTLNEVIDYCIDLLPNTKSFRCHRYYDVNDVNDYLYEQGFRYDSNLCTLLQKVDPFFHRSGLLRFPIYFEDGAYLLHNGNLNFNQVVEQIFYLSGLMIINVHPMHMVLNSPHFLYAKKIKDNLSREEWNTLNFKDFDKIKYSGLGIRDFVVDLLEFVYKNNIKTYTLKELYEKIISQ